MVSYQEQLPGQSEKPYLFRTYKNLHRSVDPRERLIDRNPGPAHDLPIWEVARATSAAPTYFKEVTIEKQNYVDGGFGANNPSVEIYEEVRRMNNNNNQCISAIISIGTGKNNEQRMTSKRTRIRNFFEAGLGKYINYINFAKKWATNSEIAHIEMTRRWLAAEKGFEYFRFNVESGLDSMKLDEWRQRGRLRVGAGKCLAWMKAKRKPGTRSGIELSKVTNSGSSSENNTANNFLGTHPTPTHSASVGRAAAADDDHDDDHHHHPQPPPWFQPHNSTLENIRVHTVLYLARPDVQSWIATCAQILVRGRRERALADKERWLRACFGAWYQCNIGLCPRGEKEYQDRHALEKHLLDKHGDVYRRRRVGDDDVGRSELERAIERCKVVVH